MRKNRGVHQIKDHSVVETKRHKPCLNFCVYRYIQDKIQNRTIYRRCENRTHCDGRAHQLVGNASSLILTIKYNQQPFLNNLIMNQTGTIESLNRQQRHFKTSFFQANEEDDLSLSPTSSTMTSPIKLENHQNRQLQHFQQHGPMGKNLHLSEVITTAAATHPHHYNGLDTHPHSIVDPAEMTKLLSNITTSTSSALKMISTSSTIDYPSRLNHFSWEEIEGRYLPVIFRNENDCLQRYTSKMFVENTLFQSESWQRHIVLARSLPPLISSPYTENELKLFRLIVEWHLAGFHFKTILPTDCLIRFDDLLDFYSALKKLRDNVSTTSFNRQIPPTPTPSVPSLIPMGPPKQRLPPSSNGSSQSFELPTMGGNPSLKVNSHHRQSSATVPGKAYLPSVHQSHPSNHLLQQSADVLASLANPSSQPFNYPPSTIKSSIPIAPSSFAGQWNEGLTKSNDKIRSSLPRPGIPLNNSLPKESALCDKRFLPQKIPQQTHENHSNYMPTNPSRETKESGWVQINNVFVPYIVKIKLRENELEKCSTRQPPPQLQREFYVPYEILIKCNIFSDNEFAFKKFLIKATQQDFDIFNNLISNINIFDEKVPEKTLLVNLYHVMIGLQRILYVKLLATKQPRTQVNKFHSEVLTHKGGTLLMDGNKLVPYIIQNNRFYVPLMYAYHSLPQTLLQAKRGARAPRQYEIDYLNLLFLYFSIDSPPLTPDTLLVDAFSIKSTDLPAPVHFQTLNEHQQHERHRLLNTLMRINQTNAKVPSKSQQQATKSSVVVHSSMQKSSRCSATSVVVNPLIHHPSFYGLPSSTSPVKPTSSSSIPMNPSLLPMELATKRPLQQVQLKTIQYDNRTLTAIVKSSDLPKSDWKISVQHIFDRFLFDINYEKFIQWCQTNLLLSLIKLDDEEKKIVNDYQDDYFVYFRHLERCTGLLNELKRGTISMTLLPSSNNESQQQQQQTEGGPVKLQLAGAKKRKTTVPTTRHVPFSSQSPPIPVTNNPNPVTVNTSCRSPELLTSIEPTPAIPSSSPPPPLDNLPIENDDDDDNDDFDEGKTNVMPVVAAVQEEQTVQEPNSSFLIVESNDGDDGKIHLDDTLPSCSSGYESAAALTNIDVNMPHNASSDDDDDVEDDDETNSNTHSPTCQSEHSLTPILSTVSSNVALDLNHAESTHLSPVISNQKLNLRQRNKQDKCRARSPSPMPRHTKRKRSSNEQDLPGNTITSEQIEHHLRTLLTPVNEQQRRTRTRPIKTPVRLVEEIASTNPVKSNDIDHHFDSYSTSPSVTSPDAITKSYNNDSSLTPHTHETCTYNVTISTKPNKLGLTIKKVIQR
ncbi:unnamed protein product [Adineta ricciae]|uniref:Uncharacterized protein n=1 Tax=Adineta ricciae TaxID=249248 RepID=A0A814SF91_ADIRI|nr:unnamed protein product [Adineta ricciae]